MKNIILALTLLMSSFAHAFTPYQSLEERIRSNNFRCSEPEFILKGFWGDWLGQSFAMKAREYAPAEKCEQAILSLYGGGDDALFNLFDQIKSLKDPQMLAPLLGHVTKFDAGRKDMVITRLRQLGVNFEDNDNTWAILIARFAAAKRDGFAHSDEKALNAHARKLLKNVPLSPKAYDKEYFFTPQRKLSESIFDLNLQLRPYRQGLTSAATMTEVADKLIASSDLTDWIKSSARYGEEFHTLRLIPYLIRNEQQDLFTDKQFSFVNELHNALTALASANVAMTKRITAFSKPGQFDQAMQFSFLNSELCPAILGAAADKTSFEFRLAALDLFKKLECRTLYYYKDGVTIIPPNQIHIGFRQIVQLAYETSAHSSTLLSDLLRSGAKVDVDALNPRTTAFVKACSGAAMVEAYISRKNAMPLLAEALDAKCEPLTNLLVSKAKNQNVDSNDVASFLAALPKEKLTQLGAKRAETLMNIAGAKLPAQKTAELQDFFAPPEPNPSKFTWRGTDFDLVADKLTRAQLRFLKSLRSAANEKQIVIALREGLLAKQLEARKLSKEDLTEVQDSIRSFKALGLKSGLRETKTLLDKTLSVGGGASTYNAKFTSVFDIFRSRRAQCVSGTEFMLLHLSNLETLMADGQIALTIHRPRHVLPATFDQRKKQIEMVESTADGEARGLLRLRTKQLPQDTQVILADDYLVFQILSDVLSKPAEARAFALSRAENLLKIKQGAITPEKPQAAGPGDSFNQTIFSFGNADIPEGDVPRVKLEQLPNNFSPAQMIQPGHVSNGAGFAGTESVKPSGRNQQMDPVSSLIEAAQGELSFLRRYGPMFWMAKPESVEILREAFASVKNQDLSWLMERIVESPRAMFVLPMPNMGTTLEMGLESPEQKSSVSESTRREYMKLRNLNPAPIVLAQSKLPLSMNPAVLHWALKDSILILKINRRGEAGRAFELSVMKYEYLPTSPASPRNGSQKEGDPT